MKHFIKHFFLFFGILTIAIPILILTTSHVKKSNGFDNWSSESNLLFLKEGQNYDLLFLGISHARVFSRKMNHSIVERILNRKIVNLGKGGGICGVSEQLFYLDYFFYKKNQVSKIVYVLSPPMMFSKTLPIATNTFDDEPFDKDFLYRYCSFDSRNKQSRIISYFQSKLHPKFLFMRPEKKEKISGRLDSIDFEKIEQGQKAAFSGEDLNYDEFNRATKIVESTIKLAKRQNADVVLLITPTLFGKWKGNEDVTKFALDMMRKYDNVEFLDHSESILNPYYYYDNHHLNSDGVEYYTEKFLKGRI